MAIDVTDLVMAILIAWTVLRNAPSNALTRVVLRNVAPPALLASSLVTGYVNIKADVFFLVALLAPEGHVTIDVQSI